MTISKEERAEWRESAKSTIYAEPVNSAHSKLANRIFLLCDALEAAEARAESAERERDFLARTLTHEELCPAMFGVYVHGTSCEGCKLHKAQTMTDCWLEWARQQARGGENA